MVGTTDIELKRISNANLKLTNLTHIQVQKKKTSTWLTILKWIGISVLAGALAAVGQAWASAGMIALGASQVAVTTVAVLTSASIEFGVMQIADAIEGNVTVGGTLLNALPFLGIGKAIGQGTKLAKVLKTAKVNGLLKEMNIAEKEIKSLDQLARLMENKNVISSLTKQTYNFGTKKESYSTLMKYLSDASTSKGINQASRNIANGAKYTANGVNDLLEFNALLKKVSPELFPHVEGKYYKIADNLVKGTEKNLNVFERTPKVLLDKDKFAKLLKNIPLKSPHESEKVVWALYGMKQAAYIQERLLNKISRLGRNINKFFEVINPTYWLKKEIKKIVSGLKDETVKLIEKQVAKNSNNSNKALVDKINKINGIDFATTLRTASENVDNLLIDVDSKWIMAYKFKKVMDDYVVAIYFQNTKYLPQIYKWDEKQFNSWVKATTDRKIIDKYYSDNMEMQNHAKTSYFNAATNFMPTIVKEFINNVYNTFMHIKKLKGLSTSVKSVEFYRNAASDVKEYTKNEILGFGASLMFTTTAIDKEKTGSGKSGNGSKGYFYYNNRFQNVSTYNEMLEKGRIL
ncbi:hypothetical protein [Mesoplasma lactucae]|uniref:Uncharacterized protein n=1 Tax=Mesoplasma lactucae ATCC 49193 TaxID=81460 RepID=A0A291IRX8_9MOLU|nr:hypothetical protein [Mesoplasma lactucae]ATG97504.1 hypothetical protein CP520_01920 [Mesoplasma lactucae ATCC 49193]ATZ20040.1 hypothetical protein MLACT_v1c02180 [Mesoplasma lactucae ATCC 49193]MCL8217009.1 hypothetical protein [Mesoplasma lactucae ATCC 49193]